MLLFPICFLWIIGSFPKDCFPDLTRGSVDHEELDHENDRLKRDTEFIEEFCPSVVVQHMLLVHGALDHHLCQRNEDVDAAKTYHKPL